MANKDMGKGELRMGDLVLAKLKGFPAWPAKISRPEDRGPPPDPNKYFVQFFGTHEIEAKNKLLERCEGKTSKYFAQAVHEITAAFEESLNHNSDILGNEALCNAVEPSLAKPKTLDRTDHREAGKDGNSDKFESSADSCLLKIVGNNGAETKPDIGEEDSYHRAKCVRDGRDAIGNNLIGPNQKLKGSKNISFDNEVVSDLNITSSKSSEKFLKEKSRVRVCGVTHEYALCFKTGILGKKKRFESKNAAKRHKKQCKNTRLLPVSEGKAEGSDSTGVVSILKRKFVSEVSARGGKPQFDKEVDTYTERHKQTVEHKSVASFSVSQPERKSFWSSAGDVKGPDSLLQGDTVASGGDATGGFDPIRNMEGMIVDEYGSNMSFELSGLLCSHIFGDEELPSTSQEVQNTHIEESVHALSKLEAVNDVVEMEEPSYVCGIEAKEDSLAETT